MQINSCRPYRSQTTQRSLLRLADGISVFKIYYLSIVGRDDPTKYEWEHSPLTIEDFETRLLAGDTEGVGFITAFPHIAKVFRFAPSMETVLHVRAFHTADLAPLDLAREDGYVEFACYAEAAIAAEEYHAWAKAATVEEYLAFRSDFDDGPVASHRKLAEYWRRVAE
jgi:hypothetical protein